MNHFSYHYNFYKYYLFFYLLCFSELINESIVINWASTLYKTGTGEHSKACDYNNVSIHEGMKDIDVQSFQTGLGRSERDHCEDGWLWGPLFSELKTGPQDLTKVTLDKSFNFSVLQFPHL